MAKQMVNPIERHVEKLVVGVAGLILVAAVALYLVSSPNKVEMGGEAVTPKTVDAAVAERANEILARIRSTDAKGVVTPEPLADDFAGSLAPLEPAKLALAVPLGPAVPLIDAPSSTLGKVSLVEVVRPEKVGVTFGRSTIKARDASGKEIYRPANWATVSAIFDYKQQVELQKRTYGAKWDQIVVVSPEVQRRVQRPDGSWSDEDWQDITPTPDWPMPALPNIELEEKRDGTLVPTNAALTEYTNFMRPLGDLKYQLEVLRPYMYLTVNGDQWKFPILTSYPDVIKQDDDYLNPDGSSAAQTDRYGLAAAPAGAAPAVAAKDPTEAQLDEIREMLDRAKKEQLQELAVQAFNRAFDVINSTTASAPQKQKAQKLKDEANLLEQDIKRAQATGGQRKPAEDKAGPVVRQRQPIQQVWAHDAAPDSLLDGYTYQYRIRHRILNTLAADPAKFEDPEDATKVVLAGAWSDPTDAITFEPSSLFFVTYEDRSKKLVGVEFFRWYYGVWLKSRRANLGVGERLFTMHRDKAPSLEDPSVVENPEVEWSSDGKTGEVIVDVDLARDMLERKTTRGSEGVSFGAPKKETAMAYMDAEGRLHERFVALDKDHPAKREAAGRVWTPKP